MTFERLTEWSPGYNHVPEGKGRHCAEVRFVLKGEKAAIQFLLMTGWNHSSDRRPDHMIECPDGVLRPEHIRAMPADIGYHAREPQYEGQHSQDDCRYLNGAPCYYDGSGTRAAHFFDILTDKGGDALWKALEDEYEARFVVGVPDTIDTVGFGNLDASEIVVCTRNGTHAFDRNPEQPTTPRPKKGHWPKPVRQTVIKP